MLTYIIDQLYIVQLAVCTNMILSVCRKCMCVYLGEQSLRNSSVVFMYLGSLCLLMCGLCLTKAGSCMQKLVAITPFSLSSVALLLNKFTFLKFFVA